MGPIVKFSCIQSKYLHTGGTTGSQKWLALENYIFKVGSIALMFSLVHVLGAHSWRRELTEFGHVFGDNVELYFHKTL